MTVNNRLTIIMGHYGSGKSEFAVNYAKKLFSSGEPVVLADLDIVNPYFRSREARESLEKLGIKVVSDTLNSTKGLDMPYLSPAIKGYLSQNQANMILDCGGDHVGARVLRQYLMDIEKRDYEVLMIVNVFRPETSNPSQIIAMQKKLEQETGLRISAYVNNSNFLRETTIDDMVYADQILKEVTAVTGIPVKYVSGLPSLIGSLPETVSGERFMFDLSLRSEWF